MQRAAEENITLGSQWRQKKFIALSLKKLNCKADIKVVWFYWCIEVTVNFGKVFKGGRKKVTGETAKTPQIAGLLDIYHLSTFLFLSINAVRKQDELALQGSKGRRGNKGENTEVFTVCVLPSIIQGLGQVNPQPAQRDMILIELFVQEYRTVWHCFASPLHGSQTVNPLYYFIYRAARCSFSLQ